MNTQEIVNGYVCGGGKEEEKVNQMIGTKTSPSVLLWLRAWQNKKPEMPNFK